MPMYRMTAHVNRLRAGSRARLARSLKGIAILMAPPPPGLINAVTRVWQSLLEGLQADEGMTTNQKLLRACPQLLISFAVFGHKSDAADLLAKAVIRDIRKELQVPGVPNLGECQQVLANTVWSLALLEMLDKPYVGKHRTNQTPH